MAIPIGRAVPPPNRATLSQLLLNLLHLLTRPHPGCHIASLLSASFGSPSGHEFLYQSLTLVGEQGRMGTTPQTTPHDKIAAIRRDGILHLH
jgi:hypothetical protein